MEFSKVKSLNNNKDAIVTIASGFVLIKEGKVLLSKDKKDDFWKFPGGTMQDNESAKQTAIRELKEESGLTSEPSEDPILYSFHKETDNEVKYYVLIHYFSDKYNGNLKPNDEEVLEAKFFDIKSIPTNLAPNVQQVLKEILNKQ